MKHASPAWISTARTCEVGVPGPLPENVACFTCRERDSQSDGSVPQTAAETADGAAGAAGGRADGTGQHSGDSSALTWDALQPLGHSRRAYSGDNSDTSDHEAHRKASDDAAAGMMLGSSAAAGNSGSIVGNHKVADCMLEQAESAASRKVQMPVAGGMSIRLSARPASCGVSAQR